MKKPQLLLSKMPFLYTLNEIYTLETEESVVVNQGVLISGVELGFGTEKSVLFIKVSFFQGRGFPLYMCFQWRHLTIITFFCPKGV